MVPVVYGSESQERSASPSARPSTEAGQLHPVATPERRQRAQGRLGRVAALGVVLKEAFDLGHAAIAEVLSTPESAVEVALHRGRRHLVSEREGARRPPRVSRELVDRFVAQAKRVSFRELDHRVRAEGVDGSGLGSRSA